MSVCEQKWIKAEQHRTELQFLFEKVSTAQEATRAQEAFERVLEHIASHTLSPALPLSFFLSLSLSFSILSLSHTFTLTKDFSC